MSYSLENGLFQWEDGRRVLDGLRDDPAERRRADRVVAAVEEELRRRIGPTFRADRAGRALRRGDRPLHQDRAGLGARAGDRPAVAGRRGLLALPAEGRRLRRRPRAASRALRGALIRYSSSSAVVVGLSAPGTADDDLIRLDPDRDLALPGPVLDVDRVVLDRGIEPEPVAVGFAVVEGRFELFAPCRGRRADRGAGAAADGPRSRRPRPPRASSPSSAIVLVLLGRRSSSDAPRLGLGLDGRGLDLGLDLVAEVDLARCWPRSRRRESGRAVCGTRAARSR